MKTLDYYVVDVFTDSRYKGNQLSVVYIVEELDIDQYYDISREFGYSETSFVNYSTTENVFKVRSFTQAKHEVIGAGHNLLGAVCLALLKKWDIFKTHGTQPWVMIKDDKIPLKITEQGGLPYVGMKQRPAQIIKTVPAELIAQAVGLSVDDLCLNGWDINIVKTEVAHLMVPVKNRELLKKAISNKSLLKEASAKFGFEGCYLFTTDHPDTNILAEARFFNPGIGIDEDPATGTAAGPLAGYLEKLGYINKDADFQILQGEYVSQPSIIHAKVVNDGVWVSGSSVIVMEGKLYL
ncbi:PhzF family phenazine biosynthesis protein [Mucilaginibacter sp. X5P1]|uniref:PhzF family phenazine biosynthesis protein n=1 Tax=Mucilaginibacter sp. X5P1 TaxID=2723088 RepID=UPI001622151D|nr:PhzF family phenazine biosynthesis protein [Mucilaginibacter sp. X5P1]MBB6140587.1 trans-2,3-dihydro-3-hydroxyanthranilate isomerase [Mucilaginibacter sp. X5P1]